MKKCVVAVVINPPSGSVRDSSDERSGVWSAVFWWLGRDLQTDTVRSCQEIWVLSSLKSCVIMIVPWLRGLLAETKLSVVILFLMLCRNINVTVSWHHLYHSSSISGEWISDHEIWCVHCGLRPDHLDLGEVGHDLVPQPRVPPLSLRLAASPRSDTYGRSQRLCSFQS